MTSINLTSYIDELRSSAPTPGGGSASCVVAAIGCAQAHMLCALAQKRKNKVAEADLFADKLKETEAHFYELAAKDAEAYTIVDSALKLPKEDGAEVQKRTEALQDALVIAAGAPLEALEYTLSALEIVARMVDARWARSAISDVSVAASFFEAAAYGFQATIWANTHWMQDEELKQQYMDASAEKVRAVCAAAGKIRQNVEGALS